MKLSSIHSEAERHGLLVRGSFVPDEDDRVPPLANGNAPAALVLIGNLGSSLWSAFTASLEYRDGQDHPLDRWSRRIGDEMAGLLGAEALYPFGQPPYRPFLRWALKGGGVSSSTLGMLIHPEYGLWHAYRFALALPEPLDEPAAQPEAESPCLSCETKPCLFSCPVNAFTRVAYKVDECVDYLRADAESRCNRDGCLARSACPVGANHRYDPDHMRFHMRAFLAARLAKRNGRR